MGDPIDLFAIHEEKGAQLLWDLDADSTQICASGRLPPQSPNFLFTDAASRSLDTHHDPVLIGSPNR